MLSLPKVVHFRNFFCHSGKSCNRFLDAVVVSWSYGVNSLVFSADSSAELVRCASLDTPGTTISTKLSHLRGAILLLLMIIDKIWILACFPLV